MKSNETRSGFKYINAQDLLDDPPPPPEFIVENLLTPGLTILAAAPKSGKSTLLTYMLANISRGKPVFLSRSTRKSKVLYIGLEDGKSRIARQLQKFKEKDLFDDSLENFDYVIETDNKGIEFVTQLKSEIKKEGYKVVVIDIMHRIFDPKRRFGYGAEYDMASALQKCAQKTNCAVIGVHHTNKRGKKGLDSISGSAGLSGGTDNTIILNKSSESWADAYLHLNVQGRDIEPQDIWLEYNLSDMGYAEMPHPPISPNRRDDLKAVADLRIKGLTQTEVADQLGISQSTVSRYLNQVQYSPGIIGLTEEEAEML